MHIIEKTQLEVTQKMEILASIFAFAFFYFFALAFYFTYFSPGISYVKKS